MQVILANPCRNRPYAKERRILYLCRYKIEIAFRNIGVIEILNVVLELGKVLVLVVIVKMVDIHHLFLLINHIGSYAILPSHIASLGIMQFLALIDDVTLSLVKTYDIDLVRQSRALRSKDEIIHFIKKLSSRLRTRLRGSVLRLKRKAKEQKKMEIMYDLYRIMCKNSHFCRLPQP